MTINTIQLLRRTLLGLGAGLLLGASMPAAAQTVTLSNGSSCSYSSMTVLPNGTISVTCTDPGNPIPPPPPPPPPQGCTPGPDCALFVVVADNAQVQANTAYHVTIARNYGPAG